MKLASKYLELAFLGLLVIIWALYFMGMFFLPDPQYFATINGLLSAVLLSLLTIVTFHYARSTEKIAKASQEQLRASQKQLRQVMKQPKLIIELEDPQRFSNHVRAKVSNEGDIRAESCEAKIFRKNLTDEADILDPDMLHWARNFFAEERFNPIYINKKDNELLDIFKLEPITLADGRIVDVVKVYGKRQIDRIKPNILYQIDIVVFSGNAEPSNYLSFKVQWDGTSDGFEIKKLIKK